MTPTPDPLPAPVRPAPVRLAPARLASFLLRGRAGALAGLVGLLVLGGCAGDSGHEHPYNVVLVTLDTSRADYFGCYAHLPRPPYHPRARTPSFDALAAEGVRFDQGIATASVTPVAHAAILTGLFNRQHGLRVMKAGSGYRLPETTPTLFTELQALGWRTGAFHSAFPVSDFFGLDRGFDVYETVKSEMRGEEREQWDVVGGQRRSDRTTDLALDFLASSHGQPFAMWIHYWDPHDTVLLPPGVEKPRFQIETKGLPEDQKERAAATKAIIESLSPAERQALEQRYFADFLVTYAREVEYVDQQFGRLVEELKQSGQWDRTIVIVVADHGEGLQDHGWGHHRLLYQEQIRVPYLVRVPGAKGGDEGRAVEALVRTVDLAPTVYDYLGLEGPQAAGRSLRPLIERVADEPRLTFAEQINGYDTNAGDLLRDQRPQDVFVYCAMDDGWKLLYRPHDPAASELFDVVADPLELSSVYATDHPEARRLRIELARHAPWVTEAFPETEDGAPAQLAVLADLGYAEGVISTGDWRWACPVHMDEPNDCVPCERCGEPPIPVGLDG